MRTYPPHMSYYQRESPYMNVSTAITVRVAYYELNPCTKLQLFQKIDRTKRFFWLLFSLSARYLVVCQAKLKQLSNLCLISNKLLQLALGL